MRVRDYVDWIVRFVGFGCMGVFGGWVVGVEKRGVMEK